MLPLERLVDVHCDTVVAIYYKEHTQHKLTQYGQNAEFWTLDMLATLNFKGLKFRAKFLKM